MAVYAREKPVGSMESWAAECMKHLEGAELIQDDLIWDMTFALKRILFSDYPDSMFLQLYWLPPDVTSIGRYTRQCILLNKDFADTHDAFDLMDVIFHELLHAYCWLNNIHDTDENGYHREAFRDEAEKRGASCGLTENGYTETHLHEAVKDRIFDEIGRRQAR